MSNTQRSIVAALALAVCAIYTISTYTTWLHSSLFSTEESVLFVGDVMLARAVEDAVHTVGVDAFFNNVVELHRTAKYVVINFEATIPLVHRPTPDLTFHFSVDPRFIPMLRDAGVTHASLANNHADDYGTSGRVNTVEVLQSASITPFGQSRAIASSSITYLTINEKNVALIGINTVFGEPPLSDLSRVLEIASKKSDYQIAVIHWGNEYDVTHSAGQEAFARALIVRGIDAVVGHHPHVVQDIGMVDGVPVFYSLGNYVFDQYWDLEVTRGLALTMIYDGEGLTFNLIPVGTKRGVPYVLPEKEAQTFRESIRARSAKELQNAITSGSVRTRR
jgi:poly-gamma-glutamate capsule biosynthesis protein CapA/YwtB (metallophosphatase superfamily)